MLQAAHPEAVLRDNPITEQQFSSSKHTQSSSRGKAEVEGKQKQGKKEDKILE